MDTTGNPVDPTSATRSAGAGTDDIDGLLQSLEVVDAGDAAAPAARLADLLGAALDQEDR